MTAKAEPVSPPEPVRTPTWIRVRSKSGDGHEFDVAGRSFDPDMHVRVAKPAQYPDLFGDVRPRPTKYRTDKAGVAGTHENTES